MKKPDRVEAGQWWGSPKDGECFRVEGIINKLDEDWALHGDGKFVASCGLLLKLSTYEYLGSGDHPEPSEWMIEMLAALSARMIEEERGGDPPGSFYLNADEEQRESVRDTIRWYLDDKSVNHWAYPNHARATKACIREVYRILRSLGKW